MIKLLENAKKITVKEGKITASAIVDGFEFVGVAKLKDGDTSNELEATRIAEAKMERKYHKFEKRGLMFKKEMLEDMLEQVNAEIAKTENRIYNCDKHSKDICNRL